MSVIGYIRWSTHEQSRGDSETRQRKVLEAWAQRHGQAIEIVIEDGKSAFKNKHLSSGRLGDIITRVQRGELPATTLVVEQIDRFTRADTFDAVAVLISAIQSGIKLVDASDDTTYDDSMGGMNLMMYTMKAMQGHQEVKKRQERLTAAWESKRAAAAQKPLTARVPYGYKVTEDKIVIIPEEAKIIQLIYRRAIAGDSVYAIQRMLAQQGHFPRPRKPMARTPNRSNYSGTFSPNTLRKMLKNRSYMGEMQPHAGVYPNRKPIGEPVQGYFPPIVSESEWEQAQVALAGRPGRAVTHKAGASNLFTGLAFCKACGSSIVYVDKGKRSSGPRLMCSKAARGISCKRDWVHLAATEGTVLELLKDHITPLDFLPSQQAVANIEGLEGRVESLKAQIKTLEEKVEAGAQAILALGKAAAGSAITTAFKKTEAQLGKVRQKLVEAQQALKMAQAETASTTAVLADLKNLIDFAVGKMMLRPDPDSLPPKGTREFSKAYVQWLEQASELADSINEVRVRIKGLLQRVIDRMVIDLDRGTFELTLISGKKYAGQVGEAPEWWQSSPVRITSASTYFKKK